MRVRRLDLLRYGHFTDATFELPAGQPDIHIVFGPNEAGKSTALSALEDFLFGIPRTSTLDFLHGYSSMRIGAVLQSDGDTLEARRRKGNKETLLSSDEVPIPTGDRALVPFLGGADRDFFSRMFSLDHERLRQGGREILEARDEVGQMLFSVGAGITGLRDRLKALEAEADALWGTRRAAHRTYYRVEDRLKEADTSLREHTVTANTWQELRRSYVAACESCDVQEQEIEGKSADLRKLGRVRRVYRNVRRSIELTARATELGDVVPLPEGARQTLDSAKQDDALAAARMEPLAEQLEAARNERAILTYDDVLLRRAEDVQQLHERRIQVRTGKADLPKRRAELAVAEENLRRLAAELEWQADDIGQLVARIPAKPKVARVRALLSQRGALLSGVEASEAALDETEVRLTEARQQLAEAGAEVDTSRLAAAVQLTRESGDLASRIKLAEGEVKDASSAIARRLRALLPEVSTVEILAAMPVPPQATVQTHRDASRDLDQRLHSCRERKRVAEQDLSRQRRAHERVAREEHAVSQQDILRLRQHREVGWSLIRSRYVDEVPISDDEVRAFTTSVLDLPAAYEAAVSDADRQADERFDKAEAAARLAVIATQITEQEDLMATLLAEEAGIGEERLALNAVWEEMWAQSQVSPLSPDAMLEWFAARAEMLADVERQVAAEQQAVALRRDELEAKGLLLAQLEALGFDANSLQDQPIRSVLDAAASLLHKLEQKNQSILQLTEAVRRATADTGRKRKAVEKARTSWSEWESQWSNSLSALGLASVIHEEVSAQIEVIEEIREIASKASDLRVERIDKIERDIAAFGRDVEEVVGAIAIDLAQREPEEAVLDLERRLDEAKRIQKLLREKDESIVTLGKAIADCEGARRGAQESIQLLKETAGAEDDDALRTAIERSDRLREIQAETLEVARALAQEGDGLSVAELQAECETVEVDLVPAREESMQRSVKELRDRLIEASNVRAEARRAFEAVGGDSAAASAAADRQSALAEMREVAEQYIRVRSAAILLQWAIDRYRREKQAPLLRRASQVFSQLTGGSFSDLRLEFDEQDHAHLIGVRPDAKQVGVQGMSAGTTDQLYLALRVASVEDYFERASPLPFIADDLFINFDDERAAAGIGVLGKLAQRTQVLFFTHHLHLVEIARATLGQSVSVITLSNGSSSI